MKKLYLLLMMLIITAVGWNRAYADSRFYPIPDGNFVISVVHVQGVHSDKEGEVASVYYSTATQSHVPMPKAWENLNSGNWRYYVPFDEKPTQIHIVPNEGNAIYNVDRVNGNYVSPLPDGVTLYVGNVNTDGQTRLEYNVYVAAEETSRSATMNITVDDPTDIEVQCRSNTDRAKFTEADFVDGKLTFRYSPYAEHQWVISRGDARDIAKVTMNGNKLNRETAMIHLGSGTYAVRPAFFLVTDRATSENNVEIKRDFDDIDIPLQISFENKDGNESDPVRMREVVTKVTVNGKAIEPEVWSAEGFTVKNGSNIYFEFVKQSYDRFILNDRIFNGEKKTGNEFKVEGDDATPQTIVFVGDIYSPWRYNFKAANYDKFKLQIGYQDVQPTGEEGDYTYNSTQPVKVSVKSDVENDFKVVGVKYNDEVITADERGYYEFTMDQQDCKIEVDCQPYVRDKEMPYTLCGERYKDLDIILNPGGPKEKRISLAEDGILYYNPADLPIELRSANSDVYVDNVRLTPDENGLYLTGYAGGKVKFFNHTATPITIYHEAFPAGVNATITHDGEPVQPGQQYRVAPFTEVKYVITQGSNLVIENTDRIFYTPKSAGTYIERPKYTCNFKLHQANPYFNVQSEQLKYLSVEVKDLPLEYYTYQYFADLPNLTGTSARIDLPYTYDASDYTKAYAIRLQVPSRDYKITDVTSTPAGAVYDASTATVSGIKTGMTLNVTTEPNEKPYSLNIRVAVPDGWYQKENEDDYSPFPGWAYLNDWGVEVDVAMDKIMPFTLSINQQTDDSDGDYMSASSVPLLLGINNSATNPFAQMGGADLFNLAESDFPVTIKYNVPQDESGGNIDLYNMPATVLVNGEKLEFIERTVDNWGMTETEYVVVIEKPQSFDAVCYPAQLDPATLDIGSKCDYKYSVDGSEPVEVKRGNTNRIMVYPEQQITIYPPEGVTISTITGSYMYYNTNDYSYEEVEEQFTRDGNAYKWTLPRYNAEYTYGWREYSFDVQIKQPTIRIAVSGRYTYINMQASISVKDGDKNDDGTWSVVRGSDVTLYASESGVRIGRVINLETDEDMPFDPRTGVVSGVTHGMQLYAFVDNYLRNKTVTFISDNSYTLDNDVKITLAPEAINTSVLTLNKRTTGSSKENRLQVKFNDNDLPLQLSAITYGGQPANLYYNCRPVSYDAANGYNLPAVIATDDVIRIVKADAKQTVPVQFIMDPDVKVNISIDGHVYKTTELENGLINVPTGSAIRIATTALNQIKYTANYVAQKGASTTEGVATTAFYATADCDAITVTVDKLYNTLTLAGADGATLSVEADGVEYAIADDNTVKIPEAVKSVIISTDDAESYVSAVTADVEGLSFDARTGMLTGLATGTYNLEVKKMVMGKFMYIQPETEDMDGNVILGDGALWMNTTPTPPRFTSYRFAAEHLPVLYRPNDAEQLPVVYVDGQKIEYNAELNGFVLAGEDYDGEKAVSLVKLYPWQGEGVDDVAHPYLTYMVESGIEFKAMEDKVYSITEAGTREVLQNTSVELTITSVENDEDVYVELNGVRLNSATGTYNFKVETSDVTVAVQRVKKNVTVNAENWHGIRISGGGMEYPLYNTVNTLQFPMATTSITVHSTIAGVEVSGAVDGDGNALSYNAATGEISGISDNMEITLVFAEYQRNTTLYVYLEETDVDAVNAVSHLVLATGSHLEAEVELTEGYQEVKIGQYDMPVSFVCSDNLVPAVYLNDVLLTADEETGVFNFPDELPEISILKVFAAEQPGIGVAYSLDNELYDITVTHDRVKVIDAPDTHTVLPGTEISLTVTVRTQPAAVRAAKAPRATESDHKVTVNGEKLEAQDDGSYLIKVAKEHADSGLAIAVSQDNKPTSVDDILADGKPVDVYNLQGVLLKKDATRADIERLAPAVYIINGQKVAVRL